MADWLEAFHENVIPMGDPNGLWSGRASMRDPDIMDLELYLRVPLNHITITLVPSEEDGDGEDLQPGEGVQCDEGEGEGRVRRARDLLPTGPSGG